MTSLRLFSFINLLNNFSKFLIENPIIIYAYEFWKCDIPRELFPQFDNWGGVFIGDNERECVSQKGTQNLGKNVPDTQP